MYAWKIDKDHLTHSSVSVIGPSDASDELVAKLNDNQGEAFKLYDDDGQLYYSGRIIGNYEGFEPMDDYGTPNAGCTDIKYFNKTTKRWESL